MLPDHNEHDCHDHNHCGGNNDHYNCGGHHNDCSVPRGRVSDLRSDYKDHVALHP
jgi:hypothetical protein